MKTRKIITDWNSVPVIMDLAFASMLLGRTPESLKQLAQKGMLPAFKLGAEWRIDKDDLKKYIEESKQRPKEVTA